MEDLSHREFKQELWGPELRHLTPESAVDCTLSYQRTEGGPGLGKGAATFANVIQEVPGAVTLGCDSNEEEPAMPRWGEVLRGEGQ